jgi:hypothetical protein
MVNVARAKDAAVRDAERIRANAQKVLKVNAAHAGSPVSRPRANSSRIREHSLECS